MQASDLLKYMKAPHLLQPEDVVPLQQLTVDFPYFQSAHLLLSMAAKKWDASVYQHSLKKTAIVATHRSQLFELIRQIEKQEQMVQAIELKTESVEVKPKPDHESIKEELDILKAAEISVDSNEQSSFDAAERKTRLEAKEEAHELDTTFLEKEIGKEVVNSFVEKEILKTHETLPSVPAEETPENFTGWLALLKKHQGDGTPELKKKNEEEIASVLPALKKNKKPIEPLESDAVESKKRKQKAIIDKIIEKSPGLIRPKEEKFFTPDLKAKESLLENEHLVTETLAKIYALQGNVSKAVRSYEILSLKYPQKSAYFASLIQKLKNNQ